MNEYTNLLAMFQTGALPEEKKRKPKRSPGISNVLTKDELSKGKSYPNKNLSWTQGHYNVLARINKLECNFTGNRVVHTPLESRLEVKSIFCDVPLRRLISIPNRLLTPQEVSTIFVTMGLPYSQCKCFHVMKELEFLDIEGKPTEIAEKYGYLVAKKALDEESNYLGKTTFFTPDGLKELYRLMFQEGLMVLASVSYSASKMNKRLES